MIVDEMVGETIWRRFRRKSAARGRVPSQPVPKPGTEEAKALADALNHSAERVQTLWFSFLTFMLYLAVTIGTTTHRMLFLESPLKLPVLNVDLPLLGFYILTPIIFVVFHFYMLLNLTLLARTAKSFEDALERGFPQDGEPRETFRMRIENTLFVQLLVGGKIEREGLNAKLLSLMALITLALAPVALLLFLQIKFLPYHSEWITWLHRCLLVADLALVWTLWPGYRSGWGVRLWPKASWRLVTPGAGSVAALAYAVMVATFPDERMYLVTYWLHGSTYVDQNTNLMMSRDGPNWYAWIAPVNTLDLQKEDLIDEAELARIIKRNTNSTDVVRGGTTLRLKGRNMTGADLSLTDVRHVDFGEAILNRANLRYAWAKNANFDFAKLHGASLDFAYLQGTSFVGAQLQGASLQFTELQGASLVLAMIQGASLVGAQLQGAWLGGAQLQGASLDDAQLQGASLVGAHLQGASLNKAQLQGASLDGVMLQGASLVEVCAWRADARQAAWKDTRVTHPVTGPKADKVSECDWTAARFAALKQFIAREFRESAERSAAMGSIEQSLDPMKAREGEGQMAEIWAARERETPPPEVYEKGLAEQWRKTGCDAEGAPYVLHALIDRLSRSRVSLFREQSDVVKALVADFLDEAHCAGAHGLSEADKARLKKSAAPDAPKPTGSSP